MANCTVTGCGKQSRFRFSVLADDIDRSLSEPRLKDRLANETTRCELGNMLAGSMIGLVLRLHPENREENERVMSYFCENAITTSIQRLSREDTEWSQTHRCLTGEYIGKEEGVEYC